MSTVDLNSDVGEGIGNEALLLPLLTSCNIACGGHAGDIHTMQEVTRLALQNKVKIGAHPGYEDKANFGRVEIALSRKQLKESISTQVLALKTIVESQGGILHHIKPHGALYNKAAVDKETAITILEAITAIDDRLVVYVPYNSVIQELAQNVLPIMIEGFADRNYNTDYTLVSRSQNNALLTDPVAVMKHIKTMVAGQQLHTIDKVMLPIQLDTLCVHGDTDQALEILKYLRREAPQHQIRFE